MLLSYVDHCPIWVQGSIGGEPIRRSLNTTNWTAASSVVHQWQAAGQIGVLKPEIPTISETHSFTEMSLHPFVQLGIPVILAGLASGRAWRERSGWLVVSTVCFYAMAFLQGFSIGAAYLPAAAALFAASALTLVGKLVAGLSTRAV
jgi:hypothetical protein